MLKQTDDGPKMRFFLPCRFKEGDGRERKNEMDPWGPPPGVFDPKSIKVVISENKWWIPDRGITYCIKGEDFVSDPGIIRHLMTHRGALQFDPQDAVDGGFLDYDEVLKMGYPVKPSAGPVEVVPEAKTETEDPDFGPMTKDELVEFAGKHQYAVDVRKDKEGVVDDIRRSKKHRKGKR